MVRRDELMQFEEEDEEINCDEIESKTVECDKIDSNTDEHDEMNNGITEHEEMQRTGVTDEGDETDDKSLIELYSEEYVSSSDPDVMMMKFCMQMRFHKK